MLIPTANPSAGTPTPTPIRSGSFWPELDPAIARSQMRLDGTVTDERLRAALIEAIASVNSQLAEFRRQRQAGGVASLMAITADEVDGQSVLVNRWYRAVLCLAAANLTERYRSFDSTGAGDKKAADLDTTVDDLRRDAHWAITAIQGVPRTTVELI
ncbi:bacteriophage head completion/stabilization protein [Paludibacterium paludis]|uniref:Bacteriophage head completion/stabilization protein n=2 Tax=Paludibacterium paludis TaxID=1225769 RepID=A0A918NXA7_9NEIS|nr:bacteriophage head completion/stabilization protein [Paludibacterium paludis]